MNIPTFKLSTGFKMPVLGLGTWELTGSICAPTIRKALEMGYRHIDTADWYENHVEVGEGIRDFDRSAIFITSKVRPTDLRYSDVLKMCDKALRELRTDYLDLYLIHWPNPDIPLEDTLRAFNVLHSQRKVRSFGVSNFSIELLQQAMDLSAVPIVNNQVPFHPLDYPRELLEFCQANDVTVTSYSPLGRGQLLGHRVIKAVAEKCHRSPAQVCLRWGLQKGTVVIPKASSEEHLRENMDIFDWSLSPEDEEKLDNIKR